MRGKNCLLRSSRRRRRNLDPEEVREDGGEGISHNVFLSFNVGFNFATNYNFFLLLFSFFLVFEGDGKCSGIMM